MWLGLAERHAAFAMKCRSSDQEIDDLAERLVDDATDTPTDRTVGGGTELEHTMVAVASATHALDGLYGTIKPFVGPPKSNAARHRQIIETLKLGFHIGAIVATWLIELE